jgi:hypothetical protein
MKFAAASLLAAAAFSAATTASLAATSIKKFDDKTIEDVLAAVGATNIEQGSDDQGSFRVFKIGELKFVTASRVCKPDTGCMGLLVQSSFTGQTFSTATANKFNLTHIFSNVAVSEDRKTLFLGRYMIADGGTTLANTIENFKVFFTFPALLVNQVKQDSSTPIAEIVPQTTPVSASGTAVAATAATALASGVAAEAKAGQTGDWIQGHENVLKQ